MTVEVGMDRRSTAIDMLRGVAILLVLTRHWPASRFGFTQIGWVGVDLFFVISGFLISSLLFRELDRTGEIDLGRFWLRRGLRIWPAYFAAFLAVIAVTMAHQIAGGSPPSLPIGQWPNLVLIQNYFPEAARWRHTWSLAIEEHFYIALPLVITFVARRRVPLIGASVFLFCLFARLVSVAAGADWTSVYYQTHCRLDGLMAGVLIGYAARYNPELLQRIARHPIVVWAICAVTLVVVAFNPLETSRFTITFGFSMLALAFGGVVALAAVASDFGAKWAPARLLAGVGLYSYTIYLAHGAMVGLPSYRSAMDFVISHTGLWGGRAAFVAMALLGGWALAWTIERPALALRKRLTRTQTTRASAPVVAATE